MKKKSYAGTGYWVRVENDVFKNFPSSIRRSPRYYSSNKMSKHYCWSYWEETKIYIFGCIKFKQSSIPYYTFIFSDDLLKNDLYWITELMFGDYYEKWLDKASKFTTCFYLFIYLFSIYWVFEELKTEPKIGLTICGKHNIKRYQRYNFTYCIFILCSSFSITVHTKA